MSAALPGQLALLAAVPAVPLALALMLTRRGRWADLGLRIAPWAALPGLVAVIWAGGTELSMPWLLLGSRVGLDSSGRAFLGFSAFLWLVAGIYSRGYLAHDPRARRFFAFFLLSMSGNLGLVVALDALTFFAFYTLMSFASYGLVVHERSCDNLRAGRVYIVLVVLGEVLVFAGLALTVTVSDYSFPLGHREVSPTAVGLLVVGFGIKAGTLPLHVWLPLAHPAAPTPASAVLSGAMIKAGVLGWIRFLPLGVAELPAWGITMVAVGLLGVFYGVAVGLSQRDPKVVLAYSSISQMGYLTVMVGVGLLAPALWPAALAALLAYVIHHGLAKGALFLGVGAAAAGPRSLVLLGLALPAVSLAGASLTSGASAKAALSGVLSAASLPASQSLGALLWVAALGTALLMGRFLVVVFARRGPGHPIGRSGWTAWVVSVLAVTTAILWMPGSQLVSAPAASAPVLAGGILSLLLWRYGPRLAAWPRTVRVPPGDVLVPLARFGMPMIRKALSAERKLEMFTPRAAVAVADRGGVLASAARLAERRLLDWRIVGIALLLGLLSMAGLLLAAR